MRLVRPQSRAVFSSKLDIRIGSWKTYYVMLRSRIFTVFYDFLVIVLKCVLLQGVFNSTCYALHILLALISVLNLYCNCFVFCSLLF